MIDITRIARCLKCEHKWIIRTKEAKPKQCPKCHARANKLKTWDVTLEW